MILRLPAFLALFLAAGFVAAVAAPLPSGAEEAQAQAHDPSSDAVRGQPVSLEAGTGVLLSLPRAASSILSAEPNIARVQPASPTSLFLMGVTVGHTTVIATAASGAPIIQYDVTVTPPGGAALLGPLPGETPIEGSSPLSPEAAAAMERTIRKLVPGAAGLTVVPVGDKIFLGGTVKSPDDGQRAQSIASSIAKGTVVVPQFTVLSSAQVNVRVRYAEISRSIERQLGFNWQVLGSGGAWRYGVMANAGASSNATITSLNAGLGGLNSAVSGIGASVLDPRLPLGLSNSPSQFGVGYAAGAFDVNGIIDALAQDQLATILAEPNLTAQSGEPASFLAGGEFPIPVASAGSGSSVAISVEFKQFGVSLQVVPTVLSSGRVNLRVRPEVSELSTSGAVSVPMGSGTMTIPALTVRRAETTVELGSGQSFAIAGLLQKTDSDAMQTVPGVGELPVLGALFRSDDFKRGETELVIIVTPYLVKPAPSPSAFATPLDNYKPATDLDRMLLGRQIASPSGTPLNAGFILK